MGAHPLKRQPVFREDGTIEIRLTKGYVAIIDSVDAHLAAFNWSVQVTKGDRPIAARWFDKVFVQLHRAVLNLVPGDPPVDHKDGDTLNCRRGNLRVTTPQINCRNRGIRANNTSGFVGVHRHKGGWRARIGRREIGQFSTADAANAARLTAERDEWGIEPRRADAHKTTA